jgi:hypothetical protein
MILVEACSGDEYAASTSNRVPEAGFADEEVFFQPSRPDSLLEEVPGVSFEDLEGDALGLTTVPLADPTT